MNIPKVSVIIPVYNVENYIEETLDSVLEQTLNEIEIILIDDGSTDGTKKIIEKYLKQNKHIKYIYQENSGPSKARNRGIKEATGDYIVFVDSDDILPKDSIELRYNTAIKEDAEIVVGGTYRFNSKRKWKMELHFLGNGTKDIRVDKELSWTIGPCNKIYKMSLVKDLSFPEDVKFAEDQVFVINAYTKAKKIYSIDDVIYLYREREDSGNNSLTQQVHKKASDTIREVCKSWKLISEIIDENIDNKYFAKFIKSNHLDRMVSIEFWPSFKSAIISRNKEIQKSVLEDAINFAKGLDNEVLNMQHKLKWIFTKGLVDKYLFVDKSNRNLVLDLITVVLKKLNGESIYKLSLEHKCFISCMERAVKYKNRIHIYEFLVRRRVKKILNDLKYKNIKKCLDKKITKVCTEGVFNISKMLPIKNNNVILATNRSCELEGNLRFINVELNKNTNFKTIIYLKQNKYSKKDLIKMYYNFARAKFIILDDYYRQIYGYNFRKETEIIQAWHACGAFKKFGFSAIGQSESNSKSFETKAHKHYTKVITSSKSINKYYSEAFNIDENNILDLGVPRTDALLDSRYRKFIRLKLEKEYYQLKNKKIITYAPTFRGGPKERKSFKCELDYTRIIDELGDDYVIILKLHPVVDEKSVIIPEEYKDKILNLTNYKEINDILTVTDILITDYSSVVFEFALLDRPIILFAYDLDSYLDERNFYYDYKSFVPGPIVYNNDEIINMIKNNSFNLEKVKAFKNKFFDNVDGKSTKRIVEYLVKESQ